MSGRVAGKVALITGAARGQGRSHALALASEGADVIAVDFCEDIESNDYPLARPEDLAATAKVIEALHQRVYRQIVDVRDRTGLIDAINKGVSELGRLDIVVANAGICPLGADTGPQAFLDAVQVNFGGVVNAIEGALPHLPNGASIIAIGSVAGFIPGAVDNPVTGPGGAGYAWSKKAIATFIHALAAERHDVPDLPPGPRGTDPRGRRARVQRAAENAGPVRNGDRHKQCGALPRLGRVSIRLRTADEGRRRLAARTTFPRDGELEPSRR
jgi:NAD(P)-dependent dehydrogenase (short-subunit alcohol dehydrogenase family)